MGAIPGTQVTWLGHGSFKLTTSEGKVIVIDPWLTGNPACPDDQKTFERIDLLLVTHGHGDHTTDVVPLAQKHHPTVVAVYELANLLTAQGVENVLDPGIGGTVKAHGISVTLTHAIHTSSIAANGQMVYAGEPVGFVIQLENGSKIYFAGDTTVFSDMALIREIYAPDIAFLPIGDHYTMGPRAAAVAVRLLGVKAVIPMHFATFPILVGRPADLREELQRIGLGDVEVIELKPGETNS